MFQIKHYNLPHEGIIPGARGHKKQVISAGTKVYCIVHGTLIFWCAYLKEDSALKVMKGLTDTVEGRNRRTIKLDVLLAWNFKDAIPRRIHRENSIT
jgi:hypothetical protein